MAELCGVPIPVSRQAACWHRWNAALHLLPSSSAVPDVVQGPWQQLRLLYLTDTTVPNSLCPTRLCPCPLELFCLVQLAGIKHTAATVVKLVTSSYRLCSTEQHRAWRESGGRSVHRGFGSAWFEGWHGQGLQMPWEDGMERQEHKVGREPQQQCNNTFLYFTFRKMRRSSDSCC